MSPQIAQINADLPALISLAEFCAVTGLKPRKVWRLRDSGQIRVYRPGAGYGKYYRADAFEIAGIKK